MLLSPLESIEKENDELRVLNSQLKIWERDQKIPMTDLKETLISGLRLLIAKPKICTCMELNFNIS